MFYISQVRKKKTWIINEFGLYSLILTSNKPEAKQFKRWVTHEILPSIRKAGIYTTDAIGKKSLELQELKKIIDKKKNTINERKSELKELKTDLNKTEQNFWNIFHTYPNQKKLW